MRDLYGFPPPPPPPPKPECNTYMNPTPPPPPPPRPACDHGQKHSPPPPPPPKGAPPPQALPPYIAKNPDPLAKPPTKIASPPNTWHPKTPNAPHYHPISPSPSTAVFPPPPPPGRGGHHTTMIVVFGSLGAFGLLAFLAICLFCNRKKKSILIPPPPPEPAPYTEQLSSETVEITQLGVTSVSGASSNYPANRPGYD